MTKKEFIDQVTEASQQPRTNVMAVTDAVFTVIADLVCNDDTVNIPGFGIFASKTRSARQGGVWAPRPTECTGDGAVEAKMEATAA